MNWDDVETIGETAGLGVSDLAECLLDVNPLAALVERLRRSAAAIEQSAASQLPAAQRCALEQAARVGALADRIAKRDRR